VRKLVAGIMVMALTVAILAIGTSAHAAVGGGVFSVKCAFSHTAQVDPIVAPGPAGTPSAHEHDFFGAQATNSDSTLLSMQSSGTSCPLSADTAGYWVPSLSKQGRKVLPRAMFAYYRSPSGAIVTAFPPDLRMIAGADTRASLAPNRPQRGLSWACSESGPFSPQPMNCGSRKLKMHVQFPDCWNGYIDAFDHRAHMAYASGRRCPASHPTLLPKLSIHVTYDISDGRGATLSSDMGAPAGTQMHADFWNTWNQGILEFLVAACLNTGKTCKQRTDSNLVRI
jgi:uncharacterized protein DUF1996